MANLGRRDTNNSQFFITLEDCHHLDGTNVVVGKVLRGFSILSEMEKYSSLHDGLPLRVCFHMSICSLNKLQTDALFQDMLISDCGELRVGDSWNYYDDDETEDNLPPFPSDWMELPSNIPVKHFEIYDFTINNTLKQHISDKRNDTNPKFHQRSWKFILQ